MAESIKPGSVTLEGVTWIASRANAVPLLKMAKDCPWGQLFTFRGTEADLIQTGLADRDAFSEIGKKGQHTWWSGFGDRYTIVRHGRGIWELELRIKNSGEDGAPTDESPVPCDWWKKHGGTAQEATTEILSRFRKR